MKIKNKYVEVKIGNKTLKKHNFFMDNYVSYFSRSQYGNVRPMRLDDNLYIKLDTPLSGVTPDYMLRPNEFDMLIHGGNMQTIKNNNNLSVIYTFSNDKKFSLNEIGGYVEYQDRRILDGRKITAISFGLKTFLDTSDYDLYFEDDKVLNVSREDLITTDAIYNGEDGFPYHLNPEDKYVEYEYSGETLKGRVKTRLYSVGLGYIAGKMEEERIVGEDIVHVDVNIEDDFTYSFVLTKAVDTGVYPSSNVFPSLTLQPKQFKIKTSIYPRNNLYSGSNLYPRVGDYKYIIMKYKNYYEAQSGSGWIMVDLDETYTMSFYTNKSGVLTIKDKIERSDA